MIASPTPVTHNICLSRLFIRRVFDSSIPPSFILLDKSVDPLTLAVNPYTQMGSASLFVSLLE